METVNLFLMCDQPNRLSEPRASIDNFWFSFFYERYNYTITIRKKLELLDIQE